MGGRRKAFAPAGTTWSLEEELLRQLGSLLNVSDCCNIEGSSSRKCVHGGREEISINCFSYCSNKMPDRINLRKESFISTNSPKVHYSKKGREAGA